MVDDVLIVCLSVVVLQTMSSVVIVVVVAGLVLATPTVQPYSITDNTIQRNLLKLTKGGVRPEPRIIGGQRVALRCEPPFSSMVALQLPSTGDGGGDLPFNKLTFCSAVMISPDVLLTAAYCMSPYFNYPITELNVILAEKDLDFQDRFQTTASVQAFKVHPDFNSYSGDNNIAVIKLRSPAKLNECMQPLERYQRDVTTCASALMNCTVAGWGPDTAYGNLYRNSKQPMYGHIRLVDEDLSIMVARSAKYPDVTLRQNSLLGLPYPDWNVQACFLDWGGMAACQVGGSWKLRGIITEHNCLPQGTATNPMILANVDSFRSWIDTCVNDFNGAACRAFTVQ
ncbi:hypothetical protein ACOMHN_052333 [Nucella lapillus]